eukprot:3168741-Prymnesium_polylepis.1
MDAAQIYRLVASQLQDDGFAGAAQAVTSATLTPLPSEGALPKHALRKQLNGEGGLGVLDMLDSGVTLGQAREFAAYHGRWSSMHPGGAAARFSADGNLLALGGADSSVRLLDAASILQGRVPEGTNGPVVQTYARDHTGVINDVEFHPRGTILVSASQDCSMCFYDVR